MDINLFDFDLPPENIALRPVSPRDHARQLIIDPNNPDHPYVDNYVYNLVDHLREGDVLVFNDTKVIPSRLFGVIGQARVEVTLHRRTGTRTWWCFMKNARRADIGKKIIFSNDLQADVINKTQDGQVEIDFQLPPNQSMEAALYLAGQMPLPPYIASKRKIDAKDDQDYQTVYAKREGAVAAPTAGLHFTPELLARLTAKGVQQVYVTLHVGAGTFLPVKAHDTKDHKMHAEWGEITPEQAATLNKIRQNGGRIVAVGTTSLRLLESAARAREEPGQIPSFSGETDIFITPGYVFQAVDLLMTNFHLPKSTLFMLVSAFAGLETMRGAYAYAIEHGYRFYSYGDSSLIYLHRNNRAG